MIKTIDRQNFLTTPFIAQKQWKLANVTNPDIILLEENTSGSVGIDTGVAAEYIDYTVNPPIIETNCSIALEQQEDDSIIYEEGFSGSGLFNPDSETKNLNGTFKRLIYSQIKQAFYNSYNNPVKIFGVENIDFQISKTIRNLSDDIRIFSIPQEIFGEKIVPGTLQFFDTSLDDNVTIVDDGFQNLIAGNNLFSRIQEVRILGNIIMPGTSSFICAIPTVTGSWELIPNHWEQLNNNWENV